MGLFVPYGQEFRWRASNTLNSLPAATFGVAATSGTGPTFSAWVQLLAAGAVTQDAYGILINFNSSNTSNATRNILADIGVDNAGGTNYVTKIPYLMAGSAVGYTAGGGIYYYFPLYIRAGSSIAVRAMGNAAIAYRTNITLFGQPRNPDSIRAGSYVTAFGFDATINSRGTAITVSTAAGDGGYTQVGAATTLPYWYWQLGYAALNTMNVAATHFDLAVGNATSKKIIIENQMWTTTGAETMWNVPYYHGHGESAVGDLVYIRAHANLASTTPTVIGYGLGG